MSTINLVTRSKRKLCHKLHAASIWLVLPAFRQSQQHPVQSHQTLLPSFPPPAPPTNRRGKGLDHARLGGAADHLKWNSTLHQRLPHWHQWVQCVELEANAPQYQSDSNIAKTSLFIKKKVNPVRQSLELAGRISGLLVQNNGTCCICLMTLPPPPPPPPRVVVANACEETNLIQICGWLCKEGQLLATLIRNENWPQHLSQYNFVQVVYGKIIHYVFYIEQTINHFYMHLRTC